MIASENKIYKSTVRFFFKERFEVKLKQVFSSGKMKNSGNRIRDFAHSFFG